MLTTHSVHGFNAHLSCRVNMSNITTELPTKINETFVDKCWKNQLVLKCDILKSMSPRIIKAERSYYEIPLDLEYTTARFPVDFNIVLRLNDIVIRNDPNDNTEYSIYYFKALSVNELDSEALMKYSKISKLVDFIIYAKMIDNVGRSIMQSLNIGDDIIGRIMHFQGNDSSSEMKAMCDVVKKMPGIPVIYDKSLDRFKPIKGLERWFQPGKAVTPAFGKKYLLLPHGFTEAGDDVIPVDFLGDALIEYVQARYTVWEELAVIIPKANFNKDVLEFIDRLK
jgi:hypothetical protein